MVFVKYKIINGKRYGPYYYENKRVGKKVITTYYGKNHPSFHEQSFSLLNNFRHYLFLLSIVFFIILVSSFIYFSFSPTGQVSLDIASNVKEGDLLSGTLNLGLESGEFLPADTRVVVSLGDIEKTLALSELVSNAPVSGTYYASGNSLTGTGQGYGAGAETRYPEVSFELLISKGESGSVGGGDTGKTESKKEESDKGEKKEESGEESGELKGDKGEETGKQEQEKKSEEQVGNAKEEEKNEDANKEAEKSEEEGESIKEETVES